jgi:hypothetical protein
MLIVSALVALTLTSCASFGVNQLPPVYPELPADLRTCFDQEVPRPAQGPLTKRQTIVLIGDLKKSETTKTACGHRLIQFYDNLGASHV